MSKERTLPMAKDKFWVPFPTRLSQEVDRLFDELIHRPWGSVRPTAEDWNPQVDLYETDTAFILEADLPGVREQEVSVVIENGEILLQGQRSVTRRVAQRSLHYSERHSGSFLRRIPLPASVDQA